MDGHMKPLGLFTAVLLAVTPLAGNAADIYESSFSGSDFSGAPGTPTSLGPFGPGTTTVSGTLAKPDNDFFTFNASQAISSIVLTRFTTDPTNNLSGITLWSGATSGGSNNTGSFPDNTGSPIFSYFIGDPGAASPTGAQGSPFGTGDILFNGMLAAGDYTIRLYENGQNTSAYEVSVNVVPIPGAAWLFGSALLGFVGISRRKSAQA
jgi:hypothetical protein